MSETAVTGELREKVRAIVAEVLEVDPAEVTDESSFVDDFEADSLLVIEMFARFERVLSVKIPQDDVTELDNLPAAYDIVARHAGETQHA